MKDKETRGGLSPLAAMEKYATGEAVSPTSPLCGNLPQRVIHPAGAAAVPPEEDREISGIRISACVDIEYPFTEEGKPSCLSRACPKNNYCKVCCKDWSKE